ncbi:MAG: type IV secretory system conjugative DNA transfer family protein [Acidimicrobiales bacterium]
MTAVSDSLALVRATSRANGEGIYLGNGSQGPIWAAPESSVLVLGPPRSGKTSSIIIPAILAATGPVVSTSTKPEVMRVTAASRARSGENLLYDPSGTVDIPKGVAPLVWSPLSACSTWDDALLVANLMTVASTRGTSTARSFASSTDDHWHKRSEALLATLLHAASLDGAPISTVLKWVDRHQAGPAQSILDGSGNELAADFLAGIAATAPNEQSGIWSTASGVLGAYHSHAAMATTTGSQFDVTEWCESTGTIYVCASARHQNLVAPLVVALVEEIRTASKKRAASREADRPGRTHGSPLTPGSYGPQLRGDSPLLLALDEVANIAPLPNLPELVSEGGGQGVLTLACLQDLSQARARWGPEADGWLSLFGSTVMFRGIEDVKTLDTLSTLAGEEEVITRAASSPKPGRHDTLRSVLGILGGRGAPGSAPGPTVTTSTVRRRRMPVDELSRGREGMALLIDERSAMSYVELTPWFDRDPWRSVVDQGLVLDLAAGGLGRRSGPAEQGRSAPQPPGPGFDLGR